MMKHFFQRYSYESVHLFLNQFAIGLFGTSLAFASNAAGSTVLSVITTVFSILFLFFLQFLAMWKVGSNDRIACDLGKRKRNYFIPLFMWLLSNSVLYLLTFFIGIASLFPDGSFMESVGGVANAARLFLDGMYVWILSLEVWGVRLNTIWFVYLLTPLPVLPVIYLGYVLGINNIKLKKEKKK